MIQSTILARPVRTWLVVGLGIAAAALYVIHLIAAILAERVLAIDGANFFVTMFWRELSWPVMDDSKHMRLFANLLTQFPASLAIATGVEDHRVLKLLFGAGFFLTPVALSLICVALCRRARDYRLTVFLLASLITAWLPSEQFKVNPAFTAAALCWVTLAYATLPLKVTRFDQALVVVLLIALFRSYEGVAVWGPILTAAAAWRLFQCKARYPTRQTWHLHAIVAAGVALPLFVVFWQATHPVDTASQRFFSHLTALLPGEMWRNTGASRISLVVTAAMGAMVLALAVPHLRQRLRGGFHWRNPVYLALFSAALTSAALALHVALRYLVEPWHIGAWVEYEYRTLVILGTAAWMGLAILTQWLGFTFAPIERMVGFVLATGLAAASVWQLGNTKLWHDAQREVRHVIDHSEKTLIPHTEVVRRFAAVGAPWLNDLHGVSWYWGGYSIAIQNKRRIERFISGFDPQFAVPEDPHASWQLRVSYMTFHKSAFFDFTTFLASYRVSPERQDVERRLTLWAELQAIRTIADGRTIVEPAGVFGAERDFYRRALQGKLVHRLERDNDAPAGDLLLSPRASPHSLTPLHSFVFLYEPEALTRAFADEYLAIAAAKPAAESVFNLYWLDDGKRLAWLRAPCKGADIAAAFELHIYPVHKGDLPRKRLRYGFNNPDFRFRNAGGLLVDGHCWVSVDLPDYPFTKVTTGQYDQDGAIWRVSVPLQGDRR